MHAHNFRYPVISGIIMFVMFGGDSSLLVHTDSRQKYIPGLDEGPTNGLKLL